MNIDEKKCPYCAEFIKKTATKCRYCKSNLSTINLYENTQKNSKNLLNQKNDDLRKTNDEKKSIQISKTTVSLIGIIFIAIVGLLISNPSKEQFVEYATRKILEESTKNSSVNYANNNLITGFAGILIKSVIEGENYFIFSRYKLSPDVSRFFEKENEKLSFIGIAGNFIPLSGKKFNENDKKLDTSEISNNFTLEICGDKKVKNPTIQNIKNGLNYIASEKCKYNRYLILGIKNSELTYLQTAYQEESSRYVLEYQEGSLSRHYENLYEFDIDEALEIFSLYFRNDISWKEIGKWKRQKL